MLPTRLHNLWVCQNGFNSTELSKKARELWKTKDEILACMYTDYSHRTQSMLVHLYRFIIMQHKYYSKYHNIHIIMLRSLSFCIF